MVFNHRPLITALIPFLKGLVQDLKKEIIGRMTVLLAIKKKIDKKEKFL